MVVVIVDVVVVLVSSSVVNIVDVGFLTDGGRKTQEVSSWGRVVDGRWLSIIALHFWLWPMYKDCAANGQWVYSFRLAKILFKNQLNIEHSRWSDWKQPRGRLWGIISLTTVIWTNTDNDVNVSEQLSWSELPVTRGCERVYWSSRIESFLGAHRWWQASIDPGGANVVEDLAFLATSAWFSTSIRETILFCVWWGSATV